MTEPAYRHLHSAVKDTIPVLTVTKAEIRSDELAEELRSEMLAAYEAAAAPHVVLNLHLVRFLSSVGFRPLLQLQKKAKEKNGRVVLCHLTPVVRDALHATRMIDTHGSSQVLFEEQPTLDAALASLQS